MMPPHACIILWSRQINDWSMAQWIDLAGAQDADAIVRQCNCVRLNRLRPSGCCRPTANHTWKHRGSAAGRDL